MRHLPTSSYMNWFLPTSTAAAVSQHVALPHTSPRSRPMWCLDVWPTNLLELNSDCGDRTLWKPEFEFSHQRKNFYGPSDLVGHQTLSQVCWVPPRYQHRLTPLILGNGQPAQPSPRTHCDPDLFTFTNNDPHLLYSAPNCPFRVSTFTHEVPAPDIRRSWHVTWPLIKFATSEGGNEGIGRWRASPHFNYSKQKIKKKMWLHPHNSYINMPWPQNTINFLKVEHTLKKPFIWFL